MRQMRCSVKPLAWTDGESACGLVLRRRRRRRRRRTVSCSAPSSAAAAAAAVTNLACLFLAVVSSGLKSSEDGIHNVSIRSVSTANLPVNRSRVPVTSGVDVIVFRSRPTAKVSVAMFYCCSCLPWCARLALSVSDNALSGQLRCVVC